jgi:hypothetical protein
MSALIRGEKGMPPPPRHAHVQFLVMATAEQMRSQDSISLIAITRASTEDK